VQGLTPLGVDPVARLGGPHGGGDTPADRAFVPQGSREPGPAGTGFVDQDQRRAFRLQRPEQRVESTLPGPDRPEGEDLHTIRSTGGPPIHRKSLCLDVEEIRDLQSYPKRVTLPSMRWDVLTWTRSDVVRQERR
jgi:hypothetical protein